MVHGCRFDFREPGGPVSARSGESLHDHSVSTNCQPRSGCHG